MPTIPPIVACLGFAPLALYFVSLGLVNLGRRPVMISGWRDLAALAIALSGLVLIGPFNLFLPASAAMRFGPWSWALLGSLYVFGCTLVALHQRPRLCIYNLPAEHILPVLARAAETLGSQAYWVGKVWALPELGMEFVVEETIAQRHVTLVLTRDDFDFRHWRSVEKALDRALHEVRVARNPRGWRLLLLGSLIVGVLVLRLTEQPDTLITDLRQFLRM